MDVLLAHVSVIMGLWSLSLWVLYVCNDGLVEWFSNFSCSSKSGFMYFESVGLGSYIDLSYGKCNSGGMGVLFSTTISLCMLGVKVGMDD